MRMPPPQSAHAAAIAMVFTFGSPGYAEQSFAQANTSAGWLWHSEVNHKETGSRYSVERLSPMIMRAQGAALTLSARGSADIVSTPHSGTQRHCPPRTSSERRHYSSNHRFRI
jgi:hypothetical protein